MRRERFIDALAGTKSFWAAASALVLVNAFKVEHVSCWVRRIYGQAVSERIRYEEERFICLKRLVPRIRGTGVSSRREYVVSHAANLK